MRLNPSMVLVLCAVLGIVVAFTLMIIGALWARIRSLPLAETTRRVDDLARRQQSIETLLVRLDPERDPGPPAPGAATVATDRGHEFRLQLVPGPEPRADRPATTAVGGPTLIAVPSLAVSVSGVAASAAVAAELGQRFGTIWTLADAGQSPEAIARTTGQPIGQVELILGLRRQLLSQPGGRA